MANVYLLTGFNNWGKTYLISHLFDKRRFAKHLPAHFAGQEFCVVPQSNDDLGQAGFIAAYKDRVSTLRDNGHRVTHVVSAFCPTKEPHNNSLAIVNKIFSKDQIYLIPIEFKWCGHAKLQLREISTHFSSVNNMKIVPLSQRNPTKVLPALQALMQKII